MSGNSDNLINTIYYYRNGLNLLVNSNQYKDKTLSNLFELFQSGLLRNNGLAVIQ